MELAVMEWYSVLTAVMNTDVKDNHLIAHQISIDVQAQVITTAADVFR